MTEKRKLTIVGRKILHYLRKNLYVKEMSA